MLQNVCLSFITFAYCNFLRKCTCILKAVQSHGRPITLQEPLPQVMGSNIATVRWQKQKRVFIVMSQIQHYFQSLRRLQVYMVYMYMILWPLCAPQPVCGMPWQTALSTQFAFKGSCTYPQQQYEETTNYVNIHYYIHDGQAYNHDNTLAPFM